MKLSDLQKISQTLRRNAVPPKKVMMKACDMIADEIERRIPERCDIKSEAELKQRAGHAFEFNNINSRIERIDVTIERVMKAARHAADAQEGYNCDDKAWDVLRKEVVEAIETAVIAEREACAQLADDEGKCFRITKGLEHPKRIIGLAIRMRTEGWIPEMKGEI